MDSDSKLMVSYLIGGRSKPYAVAFMHDLADRLTGRVQLSTDGYGAYEDAVDQAFGRADRLRARFRLRGQGACLRQPERIPYLHVLH